MLLLCMQINMLFHRGFIFAPGWLECFYCFGSLEMSQDEVGMDLDTQVMHAFLFNLKQICVYSDMLWAT